MNPFVSNQTLVPGIMEAIRGRILRGSLRPGQPLRQADLAQELRVSPVPLREALRGLEADGLITFLPFKGAIVTPVTIEEVEETQELAMALELALLPRAMPGLTKDDFRLLRALGSELDQEGRSPEAVIEFYRILFQPAGRPQMLRILEGLIWRTVRFFPVIQSVRADLRKAEPTRERMIQAIEEGEPAEAARVLHAFHQVRVEALLAVLRAGLRPARGRPSPGPERKRAGVPPDRPVD